LHASAIIRLYILYSKVYTLLKVYSSF